MKTVGPSERPPAGRIEASETVRALGLAAIVLCMAPAILLVPLAINSIVNIADPLTSFYLPKFVVLMRDHRPISGGGSGG